MQTKETKIDGVYMELDGVKIVIIGANDMSEAEARRYVKHVEQQTNLPLKSLRIAVTGDDVELEYKCSGKKFERIRRITGYLVGTIDRWNNSKKAEERARVKHG